MPIGEIAAGNSFSSVESIEDENRSSVRVDLSRELGERLRLIARYTFYANELGNAVDQLPATDAAALAHWARSRK